MDSIQRGTQSASIQHSQNDSPDPQLHSLLLDLHEGRGTQTQKDKEREREGVKKCLGQGYAAEEKHERENKRIKKKTEKKK